MEILLQRTGSSEGKFFISSHLTVAILDAGAMGQVPLWAMPAGWQGLNTIPGHRQFALTAPTLWLARCIPTAQLMATHSRGEGRAIGRKQQAALQAQKQRAVTVGRLLSLLLRLRKAGTFGRGLLLRLRKASPALVASNGPPQSTSGLI